MPLSHNLIVVKHFEILVMGLVKRNRNAHDFTQAQLMMALAMLESISINYLCHKGSITWQKSLAE